VSRHAAARQRAWLKGDRIREDNVKFKVIAVMATATALCAGMGGSAMASPLSHHPKPAPQVSGTRLQSALLPASAFGDGFTVANRLNTGNSLWSTRAIAKPSSLSCQTFEEYIVVGGFGDTAGATDLLQNPNPAIADYPSIVLVGAQTVLQFKTTQAAASFYGQAYARYKQCSAFTETDPTDNTTSFELTTQSLSTTTVGKNKAFQLIQHVDLSSLPAFSFYQNTAVVLAGTNVYTIDDLNGTNDPISATLLGNLINRVQALYKHH
jgi:hypothetical protein